MTYELADFGSFYAGGRRLDVTGEPVQMIDIAPSLQQFRYDPNGTYAIEGCYVQYFVPSQVRGDACLLIHGGGLTGACWETTPDARPGWVQHLLRAGRPVYVADMMERGRAGWVSLDNVWQGPALMRHEQEAWWLFRFGLAGNYVKRLPFKGQRFPVDALDQFMKQAVPRWINNTDQAYAAFEAALDRIGRCSIISHSSGSVYGYRLAIDHPDQVQSVVSLEPSTFPAETPQHLAGQSFLQVMGDYIHDGEFWATIDSKVQAWSTRLAEAGGMAEYWRLGDRGLPGHSHMLMMDHGNQEILNLVLSWLDVHRR